MIEGLDADVVGTDAAAARRDEVVERVRDHAGRIARNLAVLHGGDYGSETFGTDAGSWTVKYEAGALEYLRFERSGGRETYVVSTKRPPEPDALADAMADYDAFVASYAAYVDSLSGILAGVPDEFPDVASTETVAVERDRIVGAIRDCADEMAAQLHRAEGDEYGTWTTTVDGTRWELKRDGDRAGYLRVGGEDGIYLLSQYAPPSAADVRALAPDVAAFVAAFNEHVAELEADLAGVSLSA